MNSKQTTNKIIMIRPSSFGYNPSTALDNTYQHAYKYGMSSMDIAKKAEYEFDSMVHVLKNHGVDVLEFQDAGLHSTPDSLFPNNWISTHANGSVWLYPMLCSNRRLERRQDIVEYLEANFNVHSVFDNTKLHENNNQFLEGTGSLVLDRENKIAYASISKRTNKELFVQWCEKMHFHPIYFVSKDSEKPIYHTNVLMSVCSDLVFICMDAILEDAKKEELRASFLATKKDVIEITIKQMHCFLGNVLELHGKKNESLLVMSSTSFYELTNSQKKIINSKSQIIHSPLDTIEHFGGGGARCMIAELFLLPNVEQKNIYNDF